MAKKLASFKGCLLGLAAGDAMGHSVDEWTLDEIHKTFGPEGLMGYDCMNGYATVTAHTQIAAYVANGLLLGLTRGQMRGQMAPYVRYISVAETEWARQQSYVQEPKKAFFCWVGADEIISARRTRDNLMIDTLLQNRIGTMEEPRNKRDSASALMAAIPIGMFYEPGRIEREEMVRLGAEAVALTHGNSTAYLSGAALSYIISRVVLDEAKNIKGLIRETMEVLQNQFGHDYSHSVGELCQALQKALALSSADELKETEAMEQLGCDNAGEVLAGALYCCAVHPGNIDAAMTAAVNHSGRSAAVGAVTGAILGAMLGDGVLRDFFLRELEPIKCLEVLATDLYQGCPMDRGSGLFDYVWDEKYISYRR